MSRQSIRNFFSQAPRASPLSSCRVYTKRGHCLLQLQAVRVQGILRAYCGLDIKVGLEHVSDQDPDGLGMALLSSPMQAQAALLVLDPDVAAQGQQLGHHGSMTPKASPQEDVPPIAALVSDGQTQADQQLHQLEVSRSCSPGRMMPMKVMERKGKNKGMMKKKVTTMEKEEVQGG